MTNDMSWSHKVVMVCWCVGADKWGWWVLILGPFWGEVHHGTDQISINTQAIPFIPFAMCSYGPKEQAETLTHFAASILGIG